MNRKLTTIYIVRHGESISNANKHREISYHNQWGELESPLTKKGEEQAKNRANTLKNIDFDAVFSSDLTRAKQTAEYIALEKNLVVQTSNLIRERRYNDFLTTFPEKSIKEIQEEMKLELHLLDEAGKMKYKRNPDLESAEEAAVRFIRFIREIAVAYEGKTVMIVNHGNNIRSLLTHLGYVKFDELPSGAVDNTGYVILQSDGVDFFLKKTEGIHIIEGGNRIF